MQDVCTPLFQEGRNITGRATAAITGKRFVRISGNGSNAVPNVATAAAAGRTFGVSGYTVAAGELVPCVRKGVVTVTAGAPLTAGQEVESDAQGRAIVKAAGVARGEVLFDAASGADAFIALYEN